MVAAEEINSNWIKLENGLRKNVFVNILRICSGSLRSHDKVFGMGQY
jgi:hypothetical protein